MSQEEVEAILGGPPGDYTNWPHPRRIKQFIALASQANDDGIVERFWLGEEGVLKVIFDPRARFISAEFFRNDSLGTGSYESRNERFVKWLRELPTRFTH